MSWWLRAGDERLFQGDLLTGCLVVYAPDLSSTEIPAGQTTVSTTVGEADVVLITQSCDMDPSNGSPPKVVSACIAVPLARAPQFAGKKKRESLRKGRVEGACLLASPENPNDGERALVVDFREIFSLSFEYALNRARACNPRWRLTPPYREHFSHSIGNYFSRIALEQQIPRFE